MATIANIAAMDAILKDRPLIDFIQEAMNKATKFASKVNQQLTISGRKGIFPVMFDFNEGVYVLGDGEAWGTPRVAEPVLAEVKSRYVYALFEITGPTMTATRDSLGAFRDALSLQLEKTIEGLKINTAVLQLGDSSGKLAVVKSRTDADTFVVISPFGLTTYKGDVPVKNILRKQMPFDVTPDGSTFRVSGGTISALTHGSTSTTVDWTGTESGTIAANDFLVRSKGWNRGFDGLFGGIQNTGTYLNVARAGNVGWQGVLLDASGGGTAALPLEPSMLQDVLDLIAEASGRRPTHIVCNYKMRRAIENLYTQQIRFAPSNINAGLSPEDEGALAVEGIPVIAERFFPPQHIAFVDVNTWYHVIEQDVEWLSGRGDSVLHFLLTSDKYTAVLRTFRNFCTLFPAANGLLYGVKE